jgi:nucleoside-diphosphate-sugar epimerase
MSHLFCFGLGYSAQALGRQLSQQGWRVTGTARSSDGAKALSDAGFDAVVFDGLAPGPGVAEALRSATHVLVSVPPDADGDPALKRHARDIEASPSVQWIGYLSTIGVYGDHGGAWIDETTSAHPTSQRSRWRLAAEDAWLAIGARSGKRCQVFRLPGIYGPGRSAIERVREGSAQRIVKPGQVFNRIHVDDIAGALSAAIAGRGAHYIYNVTDDEPAPPQDVIAYAAELLHMPPPPEVAFEDAKLSPMAQSFYAENKRVGNARLRDELGVQLKFPSYREGLQAVLAQSRSTRAHAP